jgi:endonuclease YncB( thermonuclease family)
MPENFYDIVKRVVPPGLYQADVVDIYDGDTLWAVIKEKDLLVKLRLKDINSSELRGGSTATRKSAKYAKKFLSQLILGETVTIYIHGLCKYFRHLCTVYIGSEVWKKTPWLAKYEEFQEEHGVNLNKYMSAVNIA